MSGWGTPWLDRDGAPRLGWGTSPHPGQMGYAHSQERDGVTPPQARSGWSTTPRQNGEYPPPSPRWQVKSWIVCAAFGTPLAVSRGKTLLLVLRRVKNEFKLPGTSRRNTTVKMDS